MNKTRVALVQYQYKSLASFDDFAAEMEEYASQANCYKASFLLLPEFVTHGLLTIGKKDLSVEEQLKQLDSFTPALKDLFGGLAKKYQVNIIAGSHLTYQDDKLLNLSMIFLKDGGYHQQGKIHVTPSEYNLWPVMSYERPQVFEIDGIKCAIMVCYDSEFPLLSEYYGRQGVEILFVPYYTDDRRGHLRVRYCAQARAVENQCYVVTAGAVGHLKGAESVDIAYAQSAVLTPCDYPFPPEGIAAEASLNQEMFLMAELDLTNLQWAREKGTVKNLFDRRPITI